MRVSFTVPGRPSRWMRPGEDSRKGKKTHRFTDAKAEAGKRSIKDEAALAWGKRDPLTGPVLLHARFIFAIPPSWPRALRAAALEGRVWHVSDPDLDQLVKQVKDALKHVAYVDDNQVVGYRDSAKRYGYPERTEIVLEALPQPEDAVTPGQRRLERKVHEEGWAVVLGVVASRRAQSKTKPPASPKSRPLRFRKVGR